MSYATRFSDDLGLKLLYHPSQFSDKQQLSSEKWEAHAVELRAKRDAKAAELAQLREAFDNAKADAAKILNYYVDRL
jgi:hypothetical protein